MVYFYLIGGVAIIGALYFYPFGGIKRLKGIKNLSEEERNNLRLTALSLNVASVLAFLAAISILAGSIAFFRDNMFKWLLFAWFILIVGDAIFISRSKFYFKNKKGGARHEEQRKEQSPRQKNAGKADRA